MNAPLLRRLNGWIIWAIIAGLAQLATLCIALGTALHSPHYGQHSVAMAMLIVTGCETILTAVFVFFQAVDW